MGLYFFAKALHIIGFVAWFAGLFYLVRMFVYHVESQAKPQPERDILTRQFNLMEWRVYKIICNPAMMITWTAGLTMLFLNGGEWLLANSWMFIKLIFLMLLTGYHLWSKSTIVQLERGQFSFSSWQFRLLNEVPTILLVAIALLAVYRNALNFLYAFIGLIGFMMMLFFGARAYRKSRLAKDE